MIKVVGTGFAKCKNTVKLVEDVTKEKAIDIQLEKIENIRQIIKYLPYS